ncbi:MAG: hypothetical protein ACNS61_00035 [Candidatus Wenzhouxiangella sp. M2_3B_020]
MKHSTFITAVTITMVLLATAANRATAQQDDPTVQPIPSFDLVLEDARRALVVEALIRDDGTTGPPNLSISNSPPGTHVGDPPHLLVEWFDDQGRLIDRYDAWSPLWHFAETDTGERLDMQTESTGSFDMLLTPDIQRVVVTDLETSTILLDLDVSSTVTAFCDANPDDINCAAPAILLIDGFE